MSDIILLIFSVVVAVSTMIYAGLTWRLVGETRRMREVQTEPRVSIFPQLNEQTGMGIDLVIRNDGQGSAYNISFVFHGDPTYFDAERPTDQLPIIKDGLPFLGPNQTFRFLLGFLFGDAFNKAIQEPWSFDLSYENQDKHTYQNSYTVDFSQFAQLIVGGGSPIYKIEKHLEKLQRDVHHLSTGFNKISVITQTKDEERQEMANFLKEQRNRAEGPEDTSENE